MAPPPFILPPPLMDVFTYGTLQSDAIWRRVSQQECESVAGEAHGFLARRVRSADYPAMVEQEDGVVPGLVYVGVGPEAVRRLDAFEGAEYIRRPIAVRCADGRERRCQAYLLAPSCRGRLSDEPWTLDAFLGSDAYHRFTRTYVGFPTVEQDQP